MRAMLVQDPELALSEEFNEMYAHMAHAPCIWGFKVFEDHVTPALLAWLTHRVDTAIILNEEELSRIIFFAFVLIRVVYQLKI